jgi:hypothetical protein
MGAKKRQTMGKMMRERERAAKRARKQEKKDDKKAAALAARETEAAGTASLTATGENDEAPQARGIESGHGLNR